VTKKIIIIDDFIEDHIAELLIDYYNAGESKPALPNVVYRLLDCGEDSPDNELIAHVWEKQNVAAQQLSSSEVHWAQVYHWSTGTEMTLHNDVASQHTVFTSILYLNDDFEGGFTEFADGTRVAPKKGRIVFYDGIYYWHKVTPITEGTRYTFASWYKRK
jgi:hypothetical protein